MFKQAFVILLLCITVAHGGATIHVGAGHPLRSIGELKRALDSRTDVSEVVIHEGVYFGGLSLRRQDGVDHAASPLLIRAAGGEKVIFEGSLPLGDMTAVDDLPGVWSMEAGSQQITLLKIWDAGARRRYQRVADRAAVAHFPAGFTIENGTLYLHTADGGKPVGLRRAVIDHGIFCNRPNVTVRAIHFRDYLLRDKWSNGIDLRTDNITVENCTSENISLGFIINGDNGIVRNCAASDVGGGVYVQGENATVENCRIFKMRDDYMIPMYRQDDTAIQFYYPAKGGLIRGNLCVGFDKGIFIKTSRAPYIIEHNTIDGLGQGVGFGATKWHEGEQFRFNIIANCDKAFEIPKDATPAQLANNLYGPTSQPKFVAPAWQDYRLANDSPALELLRDGRPAGAFAAIGDEPLLTFGEPRTLHVAMRGRDGFDGSEQKPWRTIQHAVEMARPGDTILVHPGIYEQPVVITRGGVEGHPLTIRAAEKWKAVLDSNRKVNVAVAIRDTAHVAIHDFEIRWYGQVAVKVENSPHVTLAGCRIWNAHWGGTWPSGSAARIVRSPYFTAHHNVLFRQEHGLWLYFSPNSRITHNTTVANLYGGIALLYSSQGTTVQNNIMAWNGNDALVIHENLDKIEILKNLHCNHNAYAAQLRKQPPGVSCQSIVPPSPALAGGSKAIFNYTEYKGKMTRLCTLDAWRTMTGLDIDSTFADPKFANPRERDFRLQADSPMISAGNEGATIGALDVLLPR